MNGGVFQLTLPAGATVTQTDTSITITWGVGPGPTPVPPTPTPAVIPSGSVPTANLFVAMLTDSTGTLTPAQQALKASTTIKPALQAKNATWTVADSTTPTFAQWVDEVRAAGFPGILVIATDGANKSTAHEAVKAVDEASVLAEISRIRGK